MQLIAGDKVYEISAMLIKDYVTVNPLVQKAASLLDLPLSYNEDQYKALIKLVALSADMPEPEVIDNFNLQMAKKAIIGYLGLNGQLVKITNNIGMVIDLDKIETGAVIVDRNGKEHKAHSVMLKDMDKIRTLLPKIDSITTVNNILNTDDNGEFTNDAYSALIEIIQMTLDEELTQEQIEEFLDCEFARKAIKVFLDLPNVN